MRLQGGRTVEPALFPEQADAVPLVEIALPPCEVVAAIVVDGDE
jgi:hypothetical protein